ncbi:hypothetical protein SFRURICE_014421 [Spodoptera frugiperda]|nr:hypothetical protein SFRURICE_014421 [Spodoptera frugiperda]
MLFCQILFNVTSLTTNTCPNMLPYLYDGHSWTEYASISSLSSNMFRRKNSIHGQFRLHKQETSCKNQPSLDFGHRACHGVRPPANITPGNRDSDEIRRIFSPRVSVIEIRKHIGACICRKGGHIEQNLAK